MPTVARLDMVHLACMGLKTWNDISDASANDAILNKPFVTSKIRKIERNKERAGRNIGIYDSNYSDIFSQ